MNYSTITGVLLEEAIKRLDQQLEPGAYKEIRGGKGQKLGLTDINPGYVPPVMTSIFGAFGFGWGFDVVEDGVELVKVERNNGYIDDEWRAFAKVSCWYRLAPANDMSNTFIVKLPTIPGASANSQREWATKGAITNALGTSLFFLGWQASVYMGKRSHAPGAEVVQAGNPYGGYDDLSAPIQGSAPAKKADAAPEMREVDSAKANAGYVVKFGKHKGKALAEIPDGALQDTLDWALSQADPGKNIKEFIAMAREYVKSSELPFDNEPEAAPSQQETPAQEAKPEQAPAMSPAPAQRPGRGGTRKAKPKAEPEPTPEPQGKPLIDVLKDELGAEPAGQYDAFVNDIETAADMKRLRTVVNAISTAYSLNELDNDQTNKLFKMAEVRGKNLKAA